MLVTEVNASLSKPSLAPCDELPVWVDASTTEQCKLPGNVRPLSRVIFAKLIDGNSKHSMAVTKNIAFKSALDSGIWCGWPEVST